MSQHIWRELDICIMQTVTNDELNSNEKIQFQLIKQQNWRDTWRYLKNKLYFNINGTETYKIKKTAMTSNIINI